MNKIVTGYDVMQATLVQEERESLMWAWQSPTVPACNPHPPFNADNALPVSRYKGAQVTTKPLIERRKKWANRGFF